MGPRRKALSAVGGLCLALVSAACGGSDDGESATDGSSAPVGDQSSNLVVAATDEPPNYDWTQGDALSIQVLLMHNVVEPLLERMEDGSTEPLLAESYEVSDDGLEYTFTLREATFHDGSEMTAADVVYSLELNADAPNPSIADPLAPVEAVEAVDDRTVSVTLSEPSQRFLQSLTRDSGFIIPEGSEDQLAQNPVGTGPFVFEEWRSGVDVGLSRFNDYWGEPPSFETVTWRFIPDRTAKINSLLAGEADILDQTGQQALTETTGDETTEGIESVPQSGQLMSWAFLNAEAEVFEDERIRQAIAHAINREEIIQGAWPASEPTCAFVAPPGVAWDTDYCPYPYDPERSQELLAEAGAEDLSIGFKSLTLDNFTISADILAAQLESVGINVERSGVDLPTWLEDIPAGDYEFTMIGGSQQIDAFVCPGFWAHDCVPEMDELLAEANRSLDTDRWADLRRQAVELQADRAHVIPLMNTLIDNVMRDDLAGLKEYRSYVELDLRDVHWEE